MTEFRWTAEAAYSALTLSTDLQSLANNASLRLTATLDNVTAYRDRIYLKLVLGSFTPAAGGLVRVALVPKYDGATVTIGTALFPVASGAIRHAQCDLSGTAEVKTLAFRFEGCDAVVYNIVVHNATGAAFASSGHSLSWSGARVATV